MTTMDLISQGFAFDCQVRAYRRDAEEGEPGFEGRVAVLVFTPVGGQPVQLACKPADAMGAAFVSEALGIVCRSLGHVTMERIEAAALA